MNDVVAIVEGETEQTFVRDLLAAHLGSRGVNIWTLFPGRKRRRGGVRAWESVRGDILRTLQERRGRICTTMFDFYGMPDNWPGRTEASAAHESPGRKGDFIEKAMLDDLAAYAGKDFRPGLFIPYVQVHEFEALLFADVTKLAEAMTDLSCQNQTQLAACFKSILDDAGQPEAINDGRETCPSRRISGVVFRYRKVHHGPLVAGRIGLDALRAACPHFGKWLARLEALGAGGAET